jgi:O-antigen/teichoic acid export membrane protein
MGLGKVKEISKIGFYQQLIIPISSWIGLALGLNLYVVGVSYLLSVIYWQFFVRFSKLDKIIVNLWKVNIHEKVSYLKEIFPYQWRIALSWISGYLIFQLFNPVLFAVEGPVVAGQMGLTMQALSSIQAFSLSWNNTKVPIYSHYIALGNYKELDNLFNKTFKQMLLVSLSLLVLFFVFVFCLNIWELSFKGTIIAHRFLNIDAIALLSITIIVNQCVNSWATYLRCHKKEPFLTNSMVLGFLCCFSTLFLGNIYGLYGVILGYFGLTSLVSLPWGFYIFKSKKELWQQRIRKF